MNADSVTTNTVAECAEDDHDWKIIHDWAGDPGVINGTYDINYKECRVCGKCEDLKDGEGEGSYEYDF